MKVGWQIKSFVTLKTYNAMARRNYTIRNLDVLAVHCN